MSNKKKKRRPLTELPLPSERGALEGQEAMGPPPWATEEEKAEWRRKNKKKKNASSSSDSPGFEHTISSVPTSGTN